MKTIRAVGSDVRFFQRKFFGSKPEISSPSLDAETLAELKLAMKSCSNYLEYGSGGSTLLAAQLVAGEILSVESDVDFARIVRSNLAPSDSKRVKIINPPVGITVNWGKPMFPTRTKGECYAKAPWVEAAPIPDLIFIDGRYRVACALECLLRLPDNWDGLIFLDDYEGREYNVVEDFVGESWRVGRALKFKTGPFDRDRCTAVQAEYFGVWR